MVRSIGVQVSEGTLRDAAVESRLTEASKSQLLRFALLRTLMSAKDARVAVFGAPEEITETNGRVDAKIPDHEIAMIETRFPGVDISEVARAGFALASGELEADAWENAKRSRGPRARKTQTTQ